MRGQAYTLEAIVAALLIISSLIFALQVTAVTPLSASTSSQHIENQQRASATGALTAAAEANVLRDSVSTIDKSGDYYDVNEYPDDEFGRILERSFDSGGLAVAVTIRYQDSPTTWDSTQMVERGSPSDHAVTAARSMTLYKDDPIYNESRDESGTWGSDDPFDIGDDVHPDSDVYTVVTIEVTVWRM